MAEMYTDTAEFKDPSLGQGIVKQSRQQIIEKYTELSKMFPDVHDEVVKVYPSGESHIIVEFISSGTAPDNSKFELPICTIFTIEDRKITKDFTYYDNFEDPETDSN
jgi:ketosteroid isomerase-like protein